MLVTLVLWIALLTDHVSAEIVFNQCLYQSLVGTNDKDLCLQVSRREGTCFDLDLTAKAAGKDVFGPVDLKIPELIAKLDQNPSERACTALVIPGGLVGCALCAIPSQYSHPAPNDLQYCGNVSLVCSGTLRAEPLVNQTIKLPCLKIKSCALEGCLNDCSGHGVCENKECKCEKDFSGPDCSVHQDGSCLVNSFTTEKLCWESTVHSCHSATINVTLPWGPTLTYPIDIDHPKDFTIIPCDNAFKKLLGCAPCLTMERIKIYKGMLIGVPIISIECAGDPPVVFERFTGWFLPLIRNESVVCPSSEVRATTYILGGLITSVVVMIAGYVIYEVVTASIDARNSIPSAAEQHLIDDEAIHVKNLKLQVGSDSEISDISD